MRPGLTKTDHHHIHSSDFQTPPPLQHPEDIERRTRSGECTYQIRAGSTSVSCPCRSGVFNVPETLLPGGSVEIRCNNCAHLIGSHADYPDSPEADGGGGGGGGGGRKMLEVKMHPHGSLRKHKVMELWERLRRERIIHIRAPLGGGKSTLAALLASWVAEREVGVKVASVAVPAGVGVVTSDAGHTLATLLREVGVPERFLSSRAAVRVLVVDDAQPLVEGLYGWGDYAGCAEAERAGMFVAMFSSCEPPGGVVRDVVRPKQVYFSREEFEEVVVKLCGPGNDRVMRLSPAVMDFLWNFTGGHPACTREIMTAMREAEVRHPPKPLVPGGRTDRHGVGAAL